MFESGDQQTLLRGDVAGMGEKRKEGEGRVQGLSTCTRC
jgi:hypothetical protein